VFGRIFSPAAEIFGGFGRSHLPGVGNTDRDDVDLLFQFLQDQAGGLASLLYSIVLSKGFEE
jgi:hypothetical protein